MFSFPSNFPSEDYGFLSVTQSTHQLSIHTDLYGGTAWGWPAYVLCSQPGTDPEPTRESGKILIDSGEVGIRSLWKNMLAMKCIQGNFISRGVK